MIYIRNKLKQGFYSSLKNGFYTTLQDWDNDAALSFLYFDETFWITHPLCTLKQAPWVKSEELSVANDFMNFINTTKYSEQIPMRYGIRPYNRDVVLDKEVFNTDNGVNPHITSGNTVELQTANYTSVATLTRSWQTNQKANLLTTTDRCIIWFNYDCK